MTGAFDVERFQALRPHAAGALGARVRWQPKTSSTNDDAAAGADGDDPHGTLYGADGQTAGRGRHGRTWWSSPGDSLTCSLLLREPREAERLRLLPLVVGLAIRDVVAGHVPGPVAVKWPNDVLVAGRKVSGVLVQSRVRGTSLRAVVVGFGINCGPAALPPQLAAATSLAAAGAQPPPSREAVLAEVVGELGRRLDALAQGDGALLRDLRHHDALLGQRVRVDSIEGVGAGLDDGGALLIRDATGVVRTLHSGTVEVLRDGASAPAPDR